MLKLLREAWIKNRFLTALVLFSTFCLLVSFSGLAFDAKLINGEHGWIKPTKFSASLSIYGLTLFWLSQFLTNHKSLFPKVCAGALIGTVAELSTIILQVVRGTSSHFNTGTAFDHTMFWVAAFAILPVAFATVAIFFMLLREKSLPPVLGVALRWGLLLTIAGCVPGVLMLLPAAVQDFITHSRQISGHAVGVPQGGPGLPFLGWSTVAGDLRVAHFVGIHALQVLPVIAFVVMKLFSKLSPMRQELLISNIGITYCSVIVLLTHQALAAEPITSPSHATMVYTVLIALFTLTASIYIFFAPPLIVPPEWQELERT
jgi:hypothetical protein